MTTLVNAASQKGFERVEKVDFNNAINNFINWNTGNLVAGNGIINSVVVNVEDWMKQVEFTAELRSTTSSVAVVAFLNEKGNLLSYAQKYDTTKIADGKVEIPKGAKKIYIAFFVGNYMRAYVSGGNYVDNIVRKNENSYSTVRDLLQLPKSGESKIGNFRLECKVESPQVYKRQFTPTPSISYLDTNKSKAQFELINGNPKIIQDGLLNKLQGEVIDFTPADDKYVRIVVGKDSKDRFYTAYVPSWRKGTRGSDAGAKLEVTSDFVNFTTIWKGATGTDANGLVIPNFINILPMQVKELGNGNLLVATEYLRSDLPDNDGIANRANSFSGYFILSENHNTITQCQYTDFEGNLKPMNTTHQVLSGATAYNNQIVYDWSTSIYNNIVVATEYGSRYDEGIVWYSEDFGQTFKQIFWMPNHYQDGVTNGDIVTYTHIHGVMYDYYRNRIYVIAGEANSNLFWSDKGINTTDADWNVENIRRQMSGFKQLSYMQVVNGYPFRDCLVYGSDFANMGAFMRVNRGKEGIVQRIEVAHEILPHFYSGTLYCAGGITHRDQNAPVLMCITRENAMGTAEQQTEHMKKHLGRVIATYDGFNFFEIWRDNTFGSHEVYNRKTSQLESREFAKCTRDMNAWLCENGDLVIKYSGRDFNYMTADYSEIVHGSFCSQIVIYKNVKIFL